MPIERSHKKIKNEIWRQKYKKVSLTPRTKALKLFIKEIDEAITNLSTDEETGLISKDYIESSKNQIHFFKKVKNYLVVSN